MYVRKGEIKYGNEKSSERHKRQVAGYRELRLLDSQVPTGDIRVHLDNPDFDLTGGSIAIRRSNDECTKAQGYCIVEYAYLSAGVDFDITP